MRRLPASAADFFPWVQRLANAFGSPNVLYANHLCGWHKSGSAQYTYGTGTPQPDYKHALRAPLGLQSPGFSAS